MKLTLVVLYSAVYVTVRGNAGILSIENSKLDVAFDSLAQRFSVAEHGTTRTVVQDGRLLDGKVTGAKVRLAKDAVFGKGQQIRVSYADGAVTSLELYPNLPFLLIRT